MPGKGNPFNSASGYHAIKRKRGLKAWRTASEGAKAQLRYDCNKHAWAYGRALWRLKKALLFLTGESEHGCRCPLHVALEYGMNPSLIKAEMERLRTELEAQMKALKRTWAAEQHAKAMSRAQRKDDE